MQPRRHDHCTGRRRGDEEGEVGKACMLSMLSMHAPVLSMHAPVLSHAIISPIQADIRQMSDLRFGTKALDPAKPSPVAPP